MKTTSRRDFLGNTATVVVAASVLPLYFFANDNKTSHAKKTGLVIVGTGSRGIYSWGMPVVGVYKDSVEMVALCDINPKRMAVAKSVLGIDVRTYEAKDFDLMIRETGPDIVLVTTTDCFHEKYIVRALELGCNVISEKPIAVNAEQCQRIADAESRTGKKVFVGFNVRHVKDMIETWN